jgi:peptidyl-prolyl cis-trans isomerase C
MRNKQSTACGRMLLFCAVVAVSACGGKDRRAGQTLVSVDGEEITVFQLQDELTRLGEPASERAGQLVLDAMIDRTLLQRAAVRAKVDRDPNVLQAIERAKAQILAQAYLQQRAAAHITRPSPEEVKKYFQKNPMLFSERRLFDMHELVIHAADFSEGLRSTMDTAASLNEVETWLIAHRIEYWQRHSTRSTADLPPEMSSKLQNMRKNQLFVIKEGVRTMLVALTGIKNSPIPEEAAAAQIEQALLAQRSREAENAELARLRALAEIDYIGSPALAAERATVRPADEALVGIDSRTIRRGVAGLK